MKHRPCTAILVGFLALVPMAFSQDNKISVAAEEVRIDVLVTHQGKPLAGLQPTDFEILDNGVPQSIQYATLQRQTPISATLVFDLSISVAGKVHEGLKKAAHAFLADLGKEDYAALLMFNNAVILGSRASRDFSSLKQNLQQAQPGGRSALIDASYAALMLTELRPEPSLIIIFSDGRDTCSWLTAPAVLETAKSKETVVSVVSTGGFHENSFLRELTRITGGSEISLAQDLSFAFLQVLEEFRQSYLLTYIPQGVPESGWHKLEVRVKNRNARVRSRPGYLRDTARE